MDTILINGETFSGYFAYVVLNEPVYSEEPARAPITGVMEDLKKIGRFKVPRIILTYKYMKISDYRRLLAATDIETNPEFSITYYDIDSATTKTSLFYMKPFDQPKIHSRVINGSATELGIQDITFEFVALLRDSHLS